MTLGLMFQPVDPFPDPIHAGQEIEFIGVLFACILILVFLIYLMQYYNKKSEEEIFPQIAILGFTYLIGFEFLIQNYIPLTPLIVIFVLVFQTGIFLQYALEFYKNNKRSKLRR